MGNLHNEMIADIAVIQGELGFPTFVWVKDGATYPCVASVAQFTRDLVEGGFTVDQLLTMTVPRYDTQGSPTFPNDIIPEAQQRITFQGQPYRIENVKQDSVYDYDSSGTPTSTGARLRIVAINTTRGI